MTIDPDLHTSHGLNSSITAKLPNGTITSGRVVWLTSKSLQVELGEMLTPMDLVELRVELQGLNETVYIQAAVARSRPANTNGLAASIVRIIDMPIRDRKLLDQWVSDHEFGGTSTDPGSLYSLSTTRRGGGRESVREGLRAALQLPPQA
jgi:hypothetical protein